MNLNDILTKAGVDPATCLVLRHTPQEASLRRRFDWIASERPDLFNEYQAVQFPRVESAVSKAEWVAAFIGRPQKRAIFVGLYRKTDSSMIFKKQFWGEPKNQELRDTFGMKGWDKSDPRTKVLHFSLEEQQSLQPWKGRLVVDWPGSELSWFRWADRNDFAVHCIHETSELCERRPPPEDLLLTWSELRALPRSWKEAISEWRGIYLIYDTVDRMMYVGSAYGKENLYQRWTSYAKTGHGGNKHLKSRDPENFVFSILQLVPMDMAPQEVIQIENRWMNRLHTAHPNGLNDRRQTKETVG